MAKLINIRNRFRCYSCNETLVLDCNEHECGDPWEWGWCTDESICPLWLCPDCTPEAARDGAHQLSPRWRAIAQATSLLIVGVRMLREGRAEREKRFCPPRRAA